MQWRSYLHHSERSELHCRAEPSRTSPSHSPCIENSRETCKTETNIKYSQIKIILKKNRLSAISHYIMGFYILEGALCIVNDFYKIAPYDDKNLKINMII